MSEVRDALEAADAWCMERLRRLQSRCEPYLEQMVLEDPEYRRLLGQHQAFMEMRSYLSGVRKDLAQAALKTQEQNDG